MLASYELSAAGGPTKAFIIGLLNELNDLVLGEGFNFGDLIADKYGIDLQQDGTPKNEAEDLFDAAAPIIHDNYDIKVKITPFGRRVYIIVY
jgi:hypothetical protein